MKRNLQRSPALSQDSSSSENMDDSIEQKIYDWLDKKGIFMEFPEYDEKKIKKPFKTIHLNSGLILKKKKK